MWGIGPSNYINIIVENISKPCPVGLNMSVFYESLLIDDDDDGWISSGYDEHDEGAW